MQYTVQLVLERNETTPKTLLIEADDVDVDVASSYISPPENSDDSEATAVAEGAHAYYNFLAPPDKDGNCKSVAAIPADWVRFVARL
jgi:hypothetical protein